MLSGILYGMFMTTKVTTGSGRHWPFESSRWMPVSQIVAAIEALQVQVHAFSNEFQTSLLSQLQWEIVKVAHTGLRRGAVPLVVLPQRSWMLCSSLRLKSTSKSERIVKQGMMSQCRQAEQSVELPLPQMTDDSVESFKKCTT